MTLWIERLGSIKLDIVVFLCYTVVVVGCEKSRIYKPQFTKRERIHKHVSVC